MSPTAWLLPTALLLLLAPGSALPAQTAARLEIDVRLVMVEVAVTGHDGEPIAGLDAGNFELLRDGEAVEVAAFAAFEAERGAARDRALALYIDRAFLGPGALAAALPALEGFLRDELPSDVRVMVLDHDDGLVLSQPPTTSREQVVATLATLARRLDRSRIHSEYEEIVRDMESALGRSGQRTLGVRDAMPSLLLERIGGLAQEASRQLEESAAALERAVEILGGLPGSVALLYLGGRPPLGAVPALHQSWIEAFGPSSAYVEAGSSEGEGLGAGATRDEGGISTGSAGFGALAATAPGIDPAALLEAPIARAVIGGVPVHTLELDGGAAASGLASESGGALEPPGAGAGGRAASAAASLGPRDLGALQLLARSTHGLALGPGSDPAVALARLARGLRSHYMLGFYDNDAEPGSHHRIEIRLPGAGRSVELRYPEVYVTRSGDQIAAAALVSALRLGHSDNPLEVGVEIAPVASGDRDARLRVSLTVPVARLALATERRAHTGRLSVFASAGGWQGPTAPVRKTVLPVRIDNRDLFTALGREVEYSFELPLPAGAERIAVGVRDDLALLTSTLTLPIAPVRADGPAP